MATGGEINCQPNKILDINDLGKVISTLERSDFPADRWSDLGLRLQISQPKLVAVKADNPLDVKGCLTQCLVLWLQQDYDVDTHGKPSLKQLSTALKEMGLRAVAEKIASGRIIEPEGPSGLKMRNRIPVTIRSDVHKAFHQLESTFADLVAKIRGYLADKIKHQKLETIEIARFVEEKRRISGLTDEVSIDKLFNRIQSHYCYLNCSLIEAIVYKHVDKSSQLQEDMKEYIEEMNCFKESKCLKDLKYEIGNAYVQNYIPLDTSCVVVIKLSGGWDEKTISDLESLLRHYFNQSDIFNHLQITPGSVCVSYLVPLSAIARITSAVKSKSESMHQVGVFYFSINGNVLLDKKENVNFDASQIEVKKLSESFLSLATSPSALHSSTEAAFELIDPSLTDVSSDCHDQQVQIPISKDQLRDVRSIRTLFARMMYRVTRAIRQNPPPLDDLKDLLCAYDFDLKAKLNWCSDIPSVLHEIRGECSLTNIELLEFVVEEFEVTEAKEYIEEYKIKLEEFCHSLSINLRLKEKFDAVDTSPLKYEIATYVLDWKPDEYELKDIIDILSKMSGKLAKIKYIGHND